jgi:hypothetical protein
MLLSKDDRICAINSVVPICSASVGAPATAAAIAPAAFALAPTSTSIAALGAASSSSSLDNRGLHMHAGVDFHWANNQQLLRQPRQLRRR